MKAKKLGITKQMTSADADKMCWDLLTLYVPEYDWGRPNYHLLRGASHNFLTAIRDFCGKYFIYPAVIEFSGGEGDEAYLDITAEVSRRMGLNQTMATVIEQCDFAQYCTEERSQGSEKSCSGSRDRGSANPGHHFLQTPAGCGSHLYMGGIIAELLTMYVEKKIGLFCYKGVGCSKVSAEMASVDYQDRCIREFILTADYSETAEVKTLTRAELIGRFAEEEVEKFVMVGRERMSESRDGSVIPSLFKKRIKCTMGGMSKVNVPF
jgi:hypothetical protein